ncbi:MAG: HYR domain-containing protein [Pyrinomonadaceae bacterium]
MKRNTVWVLIILLALSLSFLLIPTSHANRAEVNRAPANPLTDRSLLGGSSNLAGTLGSLTPQQSRNEKKLTPISSKAVRFAVSDAVRDLSKTRMATDKGRGKAGEVEHEKNEMNALEVKTQSAKASKMPSIDSSLQGAKPIESNTPSTPSLTFDGISDADNISLIGGTVAPSDENLDVGPNDVIQTVNDGMRIWDKNGNPKTPPFLISDLFAKLGGVCGNTDNGDPVVLYDRMADRWFVTQFGFVDQFSPPYYQCVAVSQNSDPTGAYYTYAFQTVGEEFPDYGKFGVWPDGYYMTVNQFTDSGPFNGVGAYALDRQKMLVGDPTASFIYFNLDGTSHPEFIFAMEPSDQDGLEAPPPGAPNTFAYLISDEFENSPYDVDALRLFDFHADFATPANSTFTERAESPLAVAPYDPRSAPGRSDVKQPPPAAGADALDSIEYHLMFRLQYMNRGGIETLVSSTTVNVSGVTPSNRNLYQAGVRYFQLQKSSPGSPYLLYDNATFSPDAGNPATGVNRWLPSAAIDHQGNLAVSYSTSSTSVFPSIWYAGRDFNALGGLTGEQHLFDGTAVQLGSTNRWGDYQSLQVDPSDDCTFWTTNQYYNTNSSFNWRTRIGRFKFPTCSAPAQGTINGTVTACDSGAPLGGAIIQLSNGFSTTTKADGTYTFNVAPGTYTATVSANINRDCTPTTTTTLAVTDGNTTTYNVCLNGTAKPVIDPSNPSAVTLSGGNGNGTVDVNECNDLTVRLDNIGCAPARNVTATLTTSTPDVTITQPNSPYADIPIDGNGNNLVPFSFSTSPSFPCGTVIEFTLTVTFTGGSTVSTFSLPTCNETKPPQTVNGSLDPADPDSTQGRLGRNGLSNTCDTPKACPGGLGTGGRSFDTYSFVNSGPREVCVTTTLSSAGGINLIGSTYLNSYDPTDTSFCNNYLGDPGGSNTTVSWESIVPAGETLVVVVMEVNAGTASTPYSVTVSGLSDVSPDGGGVCQACTVTAPANITVSNDPNECGAVVNYPAPTTSGTCGVVSSSPASGSFFPVGTTTVNITTTAGTSASFTVTVNDTQSPTIAAPPDIVVSSDAGQCTALLDPGFATATDNCPDPVITSTRSDGLTIDLPYPKGTTTITWTATDASGNTATATQTVTVNDTEAPTANVPANITVSNDANQCGAVVTFTVTASDNCSGATVLASPASGSFFPKGTTTVTATATDASGNTSQSTFTVTVNDTQAPTITCPANITVPSTPGTSTAVVTYSATASDNCSGVTIAYSPASGSTFNVGTTTVTATATDASGNTATCTFTVTVNQSQVIQFNSPTYSVNESGGAATLIITRGGNTSGAASVNYATSDGSAVQKSDYIIKLGTLQFAAGETSKTLQVPIIDDAYVEGDEQFTVTLSSPTGSNAFIGSNATTSVNIMDNDITAPTTNPIDDAQFFVRQQYLDFLNRQPEADGLAFWTAKITACGSDANCINQRRIDVSAAFFFSQEFQDTGAFIIRLYQAAFNRQPDYLEFMRDRNALTAGPDLEAMKVAYVNEFMTRSEFTTAYNSLSNAQYVDKLNTNTGNSLTTAQRDALVNGLNNSTETRATVLRKVVDNAVFVQKQTNPALVLMEYFGYLRRNPEPGGFAFWLNVLNNNGGNFRGMVCSFLTSKEYQDRFSSVTTRTNAICAGL